MKKNRIPILTALLIAGTIATLVLAFIAYEKIDLLLPDEPNFQSILQTVYQQFYYVFTSLTVTILLGVLLFWHSRSQHARETKRRAKSAIRAGVLNKRVDDLLTGVNDPFFALDKDYNIVFINQLAEKQLGTDKHGLLGENFRERFAGTAPMLLLDKMEAVMQQRKPISFEVEYGSGEWRLVLIHPTAEGISVHSKAAVPGNHVTEPLAVSGR